MSTTPAVLKHPVPASLPFLLLGVLSILAAAVIGGILQFQGVSPEGPILMGMLYGGIGTLVLGGVADAFTDYRNSKKIQKSASDD